MAPYAHRSLSDEQRQLLPQFAEVLREELTTHSSFAASTINLYADKVRREDGDYKTLLRIARAILYLQDPASVSFNTDDAPPPDLESVIEMWQESDRKAESAGEGPRIIKDSDILHELQQLQQDSGARTQGRQQRYLTVPAQYLPCTAPLESLELTMLSNLSLNHHNRGKYVSVRRIGSPIHQQTRTLAAVADQDGNTIFLEILSVGKSLEHAAMTAGTTLAIKEPYLTSGRDVSLCIHVDHPTDIVWLKEDASISKTSRTAKEWKDCGNELYKARSFVNAVAAYEQGLNGVSDHAIKCDLHRNLAQAYLTLGFYDLAKAHASAALDHGAESYASSQPAHQADDLSLANISITTPSASDAKAHYRAAVAAYRLRDFTTAKLELQSVLKLAPQDSDGKRELLRVYRRLQEQQQGAYDFDDILNASTAKQPKVDVASFTRRTVAQPSFGKGNGLFAVEDIDIGDLVLCEKAFSADFQLDPKREIMRTYDSHTEIFSAASATLWLETLHEVVRNPSQAAGVMSLGGSYEGLGDEEIIADGGRAIDAFQLHDIITRNSFCIPNPPGPGVGSENWGVYRLQSTVPEQQSLPQNAAIFCQAALINHSCMPNVEKRFIGDLILIRAARPIKKGEEILLNYAPESYKDIRERERSFRRTWQFSCDCGLCAAEAHEDHGVLDRRHKLIEEANELGLEISGKLPMPIGSKGKLRRLEQTISELRSTYDTKLYDGLPRKGMAYALTSLALIQGTLGDYWKFVATIKEAFGSMGWESPLEAGGKLVPKPDCTTFLDLNMPQLLFIAASAATNAGQSEVVEMIKQVEPQVYVALNGTMNGFKSIDERRRG